MEQEGHVIARHVDVALVDLGRPGHGVKVFNLRAVGIVNDLAVFLVADAEDLVQRLALRELDDRIVELAAADEVENGALIEGAVGVGGDRRPDKGDADRRIGRFDGFGKALVAFPAHGGCEQHQELVVLADLDGFLGGDVVGRRIEQARTLKQAGRIGEPDRVPVGLNLACRRPARTCAAVEVFERRRVEEEVFSGA